MQPAEPRSNMLKRIIRNLLMTAFSFNRLGERAGRWNLQRMGVRHAQLTGALSLDDSPGKPSSELLDIAISAINSARGEDVTYLFERGGARPGDLLARRTLSTATGVNERYRR